MYCLIAAEPQAAEVIKRNLEKSGRYPGWRFEVVTDAGELERWSEQPDVLVVSRFLPGRDPVAVLKDLRRLFPAAHVVLLAGQESETRRAYIRAAERLGFYNVVTGKLPGDPPYTIFAALIQTRRPDLEGYARVDGEDEAAEAPGEELCAPAAAGERPEHKAAGRVRAPTSEGNVRAFPLPRCVPEDLRPLREALDAGDLDALRAGLARVLARLEGSGPEDRMERVSERRGVVVLVTCNKGGTGKTTVSVALSRALARAGVPTVAVDLDLEGPDLPAAFGLKEPQKLPGIDELAGRRITAGAVRGLIVPVSERLDLLPGCRNNYHRLKPEEVDEVLGFLRDAYAVVVVDSGAGAWQELRAMATSPLTGVFQTADYVLAVVDQARHTEAEIRALAPGLFGAGVRPERLGIVVNKYSPKLRSPRSIERLFWENIPKHVKTLPRIEAVIPHGWEDFNLSAYRGTVPGLDDPAFAWHKLAEKIAAMAGYSYHGGELGGRKRSGTRPAGRFGLGIFRRR